VKELTESDDSAFLDRFLGFEDGVLNELRMSFTFGAGATLPGVELLLSVVDRNASLTWVTLQLKLMEVSEYTVRHAVDRMTPAVLSDGLRLRRERGKILFDFSPSVVHVTTVPSLDDFRASDLYFACTQCSWCTLPESSRRDP
jgi:hypothetical protein